MRNFPIIWVIGILLLLVGGAFLWWSPEVTFRHGLGEAVLIAGILSLVVDPFLKRDLQREASLDIFHHMLGFDQQPEIKDRLKDMICKTVLYRRDFDLVFTIVPSSDGKVILTISYRGEIVNPSNSPRYFKHLLTFEESANPTKCCITLISPDFKHHINETRKKADEPGVIECIAREVPIKPSKNGMHHHITAEYSFEFPENFFHIFHFAYPTVGVMVRAVDPSGSFSISTSPITAVCSQNHWQYNQLFMTHEYLTLRWKRIKEKGTQEC